VSQSIDERGGGNERERGSWKVFKNFVDDLSHESLERLRQLRGAHQPRGDTGQERYSLRDDGLPHYIFRGQGDTSWRLVSSFDRLFLDASGMRGGQRIDQHQRSRCYRSMGQRFAETVRREHLLPQPLVDDESVGPLGQHYGLPTRLLDWSSSPYIAAYFACAGALQFTRDEVPAPVVWVLDCDHVIWVNGGVKILRAPELHNPRAARQGSLFTVADTPHLSLDDFARANDTNSAPNMRPLFKFTLHPGAIVEGLYDLELMGIRGSTIFDGIEGAAWDAKVTALRTVMDDYKN